MLEAAFLCAQLRLTPDQVEAKRALEAAVEEVKEELTLEDDASKKDELTVELKEREAKLDSLIQSFEVPGDDAPSACAWPVAMKCKSADVK